jgi:hypothetical protein
MGAGGGRSEKTRPEDSETDAEFSPRISFMGVIDETRQLVQDFPERLQNNYTHASFLKVATRWCSRRLKGVVLGYINSGTAIAPELRKIRGVLSAIDKRQESQDKRLDGIEDANRVRFESIMQRLDSIQQSFSFDKRLSDLEADKRRSA